MTMQRPTGKPKNKNPNMLEGLPNIAFFLGKSITTTRRWIFNHGLPCTRQPNGVYLTHKGLILQWIYAGHQAELQARVRYTLEQDEIASLARKMGIDPEDVFDRMREIKQEEYIAQGADKAQADRAQRSDKL